MNKKVLSFCFAFVLMLPAMILLSACGGSKVYDVEFSVVDSSKFDLSNFQIEDYQYNTENIKNFSSNLYGFDVYDYSNLKVMVNGKQLDGFFDNKYVKPNEITGAQVLLGNFDFSKLNSNSVISFNEDEITSNQIKVAFLRSDDVRLQNPDVLTPEEFTEYENNFNDLTTNIQVKLSESEINKIKNLYQDENINAENGKIDLKWLFTNSNDVLFQYENPSYNPDLNDSSYQYISVYAPYFTTLEATDFFKKELRDEIQYNQNAQYNIKKYYYSYISPFSTKTSSMIYSHISGNSFQYNEEAQTSEIIADVTNAPKIDEHTYGNVSIDNYNITTERNSL